MIPIDGARRCRRRAPPGRVRGEAGVGLDHVRAGPAPSDAGHLSPERRSRRPTETERAASRPSGAPMAIAGSPDLEVAGDAEDGRRQRSPVDLDHGDVGVGSAPTTLPPAPGRPVSTAQRLTGRSTTSALVSEVARRARTTAGADDAALGGLDLDPRQRAPDVLARCAATSLTGSAGSRCWRPASSCSLGSTARRAARRTTAMTPTAEHRADGARREGRRAMAGDGRRAAAAAERGASSPVRARTGGARAGRRAAAAARTRTRRRPSSSSTGTAANDY